MSFWEFYGLDWSLVIFCIFVNSILNFNDSLEVKRWTDIYSDLAIFRQ